MYKIILLTHAVHNIAYVSVSDAKYSPEYYSISGRNKIAKIIKKAKQLVTDKPGHYLEPVVRANISGAKSEWTMTIPPVTLTKQEAVKERGRLVASLHSRSFTVLNLR